MLVPMVFVVNMQVLVLQRLMHVLMLVHLRDMQPNSYGHKRPRSRELNRQRLT